MKLKKLKIQNFRSLKDITIDVYDFTSLIGPNNCGKSTILRAIQIFREQEKPIPEDWHNENKGDPIIIEGIFDDIQSWERKIPGIAGIIQNNQIHLRVKINSPSDKAEYEAFLSVEEIEGWGKNWTEINKGDLKEKITEFGITKASEWNTGGKKEEFKQFLRDNYGDLIEKSEPKWTSENISIGAALKQAMPRVTLIPAVSDASEETKPQAKSIFGKLLNAIVLPAIEGTKEFDQLKVAVDNLSKKIRGTEEVNQEEFPGATKWHFTYTFDSTNIPIDQWVTDYITFSVDEVKLVANLNKKSYIVYEDLYSKDLNVFNQTVDSLGLDIDKKKLRDMIHPSKKYRKEVKPKTIL